MKSYDRSIDTNGFAVRKILIVIASYYIECGVKKKIKLYVHKLLKSIFDDKVQSAIQKKNQYEIEQYAKIYKLASEYINKDYDINVQNITVHLKERGLCAEY